jgi:hypothetical protein
VKRDRALIVGIVGLIACAAGLILAPHAALLAWLVTWLAWGSIPVGALGLLMLVAVIPGPWRDFYERPLTIGAALVPAAGLAMLPLLFGLRLLYPWTDPAVAAGLSGFKGAWLSSGFFIVRALLYFAVLSIFAWGLFAARPDVRPRIAAAGLVLYALIGSWIGVDFAESVEPAFHSSIYGVLSLTGQWLAGTSLAILLALWRGEDPPPYSATGVYATALLLWGYMHAMQYIVIWAGDIPREANWYLERSLGVWGDLAWVLFLGQFIIPFIALLSPRVRSSGAAMMAIAALTLLMRLAESSWLVLPGSKSVGWWVVPLIGCASAAMLGLGWAAAGALHERMGGWSSGQGREARSA